MICCNKYEKRCSSATPILLVFLIDQNIDDTQQPQRVSDIINRIIDSIILMNFDGDAPKNRCFISVIGYNHNVNELCSGWLKELEDKPLHLETLKKKLPDGVGGICEVEVKQPIWVEPITQDGATNMLGALQLAKDLAGKWITDNLDGPAPVIINISDGVPFYDGKDPLDCIKECQLAARDLMNLYSEDGCVRLYNATLKLSTPTLNNKHLVIEEFISSISSEMPYVLVAEFQILASKYELELPNTISSGYIYSEHMVDLRKFIRIILGEVFSHIAGVCYI